MVYNLVMDDIIFGHEFYNIWSSIFTTPLVEMQAYMCKLGLRPTTLVQLMNTSCHLRSPNPSLLQQMTKILDQKIQCGSVRQLTQAHDTPLEFVSSHRYDYKWLVDTVARKVAISDSFVNVNANLMHRCETFMCTECMTKSSTIHDQI